MKGPERAGRSEKGRPDKRSKMTVHKVSLETVAGSASQFPDTRLREVAFLGKSNVGKSSLINAMTGRKSLARTSSSPGRTRTINFYNVDDRLCFVDLPGYGYAKVPEKEKMRWGALAETYLKKRRQLACVLLLIDIRHEPGKDDRMMYEWLRYYGVNPLLPATKSDKIKRSQLQKQVALIAAALGVTEKDRILPVSSAVPGGTQRVWESIEAAVFGTDREAAPVR